MASYWYRMTQEELLKGAEKAGWDTFEIVRQVYVCNPPPFNPKDQWATWRLWDYCVGVWRPMDRRKTWGFFVTDLKPREGDNRVMEAPSR